ncbi:Hydrolase (HAD superfamily) [Granulibacter bethesdensis]|uniref:Hydrolase (HAD superfamily) n=1 Tax=Granulibacter bethesdensis TaxID=364410 RepID=A0AAN0RBL5_9PROT|nr:HAD family phosphatase [Granulibacter bethesdensis]AHJ61859.1 Hydrolase (HAD superfamily) [Granulibacter bethesdensis]
MIDLVLFDMDGVLAEVDKSARATWLGALAGCRAEDVQQALWESGFDDQGDDGRLRGEAYLTAFGQVLGYPLSVQEWAEARRIATRPKPEVLSLVARLHPRIGRAVLTNNADILPGCMAMICPPVATLFGGRIYASGAFGSAKPDPAVFLACLKQIGVGPEHTLFIDDRALHVEGARQAACHGLLFTSAEALEAELNRYGLLRPVAEMSA